MLRDANLTFIERMQRDPEFTEYSFTEAMQMMLLGEGEVARLMLRNIVRATLGFEALAAGTGIPAKSLHRMLSARGNPSMNNLCAILATLKRHLEPAQKRKPLRKAS